MFAERRSRWGPAALPDFLAEQLRDHGFTADDAGRCARLIREQRGGAAAASLFVDLGACNFLEGDIDGAIAAWRHAISAEHDEAAARALLDLGLLYEHLGLYDRAIVLFDAVASRDVEPYIVPAAMASARCHVALGDSERAMETMARIAQLTMARRADDPDLIGSLYGLGDVADAANRADRAERAWRVAAAGPTSEFQGAARDRLVSLLLDQGRIDDALEVVASQDATASEITPSVVLDVVDALVASGDDAQARALATSLDAVVLDARHRFRLVDLRRRCGAVNEAIDVLEVLLTERDDAVQSRAAFVLSEIYDSYGMPTPARTMLVRVVDAGHSYWSPKAELRLGDMLAAQGDRDAAMAYWGRASQSATASLAEQAATRLGFGHSGDATEVAGATAAATVSDLDEPAAKSAEPVVIALDELDDGDSAATPHAPPEDVDIPESLVRRSDRVPVFAQHADADLSPPAVHNPYAALAPHDQPVDGGVSAHNPYAELAPDFGDVDAEYPTDVKPGDWESMLQSGPAKSAQPNGAGSHGAGSHGREPDVPQQSEPQSAKERPSAFSRHT